MYQKTEMKKVEVRRRRERLQENEEMIHSQKVEKKPAFLFLQLDQLVRNMALVGGLALVLIAVRNTGSPEAKSVFGVLQEQAGMEWDESIGKLNFVNSILPDGIQEVWNEHREVEIMKPVTGRIVHTWSANEPYLLIENDQKAVFAAADGEVMGIAHGVGEELILRLRHNDGTETIYGNLQECIFECGATVTAGQIVGYTNHEGILAFELRTEGRSIDPQNRMMTSEE